MALWWNPPQDCPIRSVRTCSNRPPAPPLRRPRRNEPAATVRSVPPSPRSTSPTRSPPSPGLPLPRPATTARPGFGPSPPMPGHPPSTDAPPRPRTAPRRRRLVRIGTGQNKAVPVHRHPAPQPAGVGRGPGHHENGAGVQLPVLPIRGAVNHHPGQRPLALRPGHPRPAVDHDVRRLLQPFHQIGRHAGRKAAAPHQQMHMFCDQANCSIPGLGSAQNDRLFEATIRALGIQTIFHPVAYKQVPLIEANVIEGVTDGRASLGRVSCGGLAEVNSRTPSSRSPPVRRSRHR